MVEKLKRSVWHSSRSEQMIGTKGKVEFGLTKREMERTVSVVRRFGGEPQLISNGSRCPMDIKSIGHRFPLDINFHWTSITRSPTNRRTTRFCPIKTF